MSLGLALFCLIHPGSAEKKSRVRDSFVLLPHLPLCARMIEW